MGAAIELTKEYNLGEMVATREAYGQALLDLGKQNINIVVLGYSYSA